MPPLEPLPPDLPAFLQPFLPRLWDTRPFVTLTYAQSLDSKIAAAPGIRTAISHAETKTMTHYLRSAHTGILVGAGTAVADDPGLNCRFVQKKITVSSSAAAADDDGVPVPVVVETPEEEVMMRSPRPIVLDPLFRWDYKGSKLEQVCRSGQGLEPWVIVSDACQEVEKVRYLERSNGRVVVLERGQDGLISWESILVALKRLGIDSLMVEGGASIINQLLLKRELVDSLIITIGATFLGAQGVSVSPVEPVRLRNLNWWHGKQDSILAANLLSI